jgi:hypothetical protein
MVVANNNNTKYVPQRIMSREKTLDFVTKIDPDEFKNLSDQYKNDRDFVTQVLEICPNLFQHISHELRNDTNFVMKYIKKYPDQFKYVSYELRNDHFFVAQIMEINPGQFHYISDALKNDRIIIDIKNKAIMKKTLTTILIHGRAFCHALIITIICGSIAISIGVTLAILTK